MNLIQQSLISGSGGGFSVPLLPRWSSSIRGMQRGDSNAKLLVLSDSTGVGFTGTYNGAFATSWPEKLKLLLQASVLNLPSRNVGYWNQGNVDASGGTLPLYNPKVTLGAGWANGAVNSWNFGGNGVGNSTTVNPLAYAPGVAFDTIEVEYVKAGTTGSFTTDIGGASLGTTNSLGAAGYGKATFTVALGNNTVNVKPTSAGQVVFITAINTYVAAQKSIHLFGASAGGATIDNILNGTATAYAAGFNLGEISPHLTIICATINDWIAATVPATFSTKTQSLITAAKVYGDVLLVTGVPSSTASVPQATQDNYTAVYHSLATTNNCMLLDMKSKWTSFAVADAAGCMVGGGDFYHCSAAGYGAGAGGLVGISQLVYNAIALGQT